MLFLYIRIYNIKACGLTLVEDMEMKYCRDKLEYSSK